LCADQDRQQKPEEIDVYAQERETHDMQRAQMATGGRWDHPAIRKVSTAGKDNNDRLGKVIGEAAPIRKGRGFGKPSGIKKSAKKVQNDEERQQRKDKEQADYAACGALTRENFPSTIEVECIQEIGDTALQADVVVNSGLILGNVMVVSLKNCTTG
jgi:hypothetical protein